MIQTIYLRAAKVLMGKPFVLWGISLLEMFLSFVFTVLFGLIPGVSLIISTLLGTSMTMIYLAGYRGEEIKSVHLFNAFRDWDTIKRVVCGMGWRALWICLWALIPIVGPFFAIVRVYRYRLVPYILMTEPWVAPTDAIKVSEKRTQGYKAQMFGAELLVAGLFFVATLVLGLFSQIPYIGGLFSVVSFLLSVCYSIFSPLFFGLVQAAFYEEIQANLGRVHYAGPYAGTTAE